MVASFGFAAPAALALPQALPETGLFGTDGIRGRSGQLLTAPFALKAGFWAGQILQSEAGQAGPVAIGQDSRNSSDMLVAALAAGLSSAGTEVWNLGLCPPPCVAWLTAHTEAIGGIMVSASHNPPADNGIKIFGADGLKLSAAASDRLEAGLRGQLNPPVAAAAWGQHRDRSELLDGYARALQQSLPAGADLRGQRIALDLAWGAAVPLAPAVFRSLGAEVVPLHAQPDGDRINCDCGSTQLEPLQRAVREHGADMGFAFDGDADRSLAVDANGRAVDGDHILYFWGQALKAADALPQNLLVATVMANLGFERAWTAAGGQLIRTPVGDQHVQAQMQASGAMLGGEQSGHIICRHYSHTGDGLQTALHLAALVSQSRESLAALVEHSFDSYPQLLDKVRLEDRERCRNWQYCDPLQREIQRAEAAMGDAGRILVRPSGTEPVLRIMVEAPSEATARQWRDRLVRTAEQHLAGSNAGVAEGQARH